jgi:CubicO group peptidase (beta-lactamase class C family)
VVARFTPVIPARPLARALWALLTLGLLFSCSSCLFARILYFNVPTLSSPDDFEARPVRASSHPLPFERGRAQIAFPMRESRGARHPTFEDLIAENGTYALLVLHHDVIVYERYFGGVTAETRLPAFSMTKTFAAVLIGCAEREGLIGSVHERLVDFVPSFGKKPGYAGITLEHLLRMTSGIDFEEESTAGAMFYYSTNLQSRTRAYDLKWRPGQHYQYGSINAQLLWEVLHQRLGARTVAGYFEERLWDALGAERPAAWSLDSAEHGVEKFSAGLSATARDYARLGVLFQHQGSVQGRPVISPRWVADSLQRDEVSGVVHTSDGAVRRGRYQWFWTLDGCCYFAKGYDGQYVFVDRARDVVIARFGEGYGNVDWTGLFSRIAQGLGDHATNGLRHIVR